MRWAAQQVSDGDVAASPDRPLPLVEQGATVRRFPTPEFRGMTFYEVRSKSVLNRVPAESQMPFAWTVNPYRGCSHACVYCFARKTHTYLDLDAGADFDSQVVVKVNAAEALRHDLGNPNWRREHVAMGTNVDCYQRAEGRYRLMPGIISALRDFATPFSILTKGSLILRDLPLLVDAATVVPVTANVSVGSTDRHVWRGVEPGTPSPQKRLEVCARLNDSGIGCGVLIAPILPYLTDSEEQIEQTVAAVAAAGATHATGIALHLRPGAREWWMAWLAREHPELVTRYKALYRGGAYAAPAYRQLIHDRLKTSVRRHGIGTPGDGNSRWLPPAELEQRPEQLALI
ncbi:MAG: Rv2578c family radical SAM protein [Geodermatophilaceae bacterium]